MPKPALRILLSGDPLAAEAWASLLEAPGIEVIPAGSTTPADDVPSLAVVFGGRAEAATLPAGMPAVLLSGGEGVSHPMTRLLRDIIRSKQDCQSVFDAMVDAVMVLDTAGSVLRANRALASALGIPVNALPSRRYSELIGAPRDGAHDPIAKSLERGTTETAELRFELLPGVRLVTSSPVLDQEGNVRGATVTLKDVTQFKEQQQRFVQAARLADVGQLAGGVAHEINTPLASIGLRAESLLRSAEDPRLLAIDAFKNFPRYLKTIGDEILRCKKIISALLEFSRSRRNELVPTNLNAIVERAAELVAHETRVRRINLEVRCDPGLPPIQADSGQMHQVLLALLMNGIEATPPGGQLLIETRAQADERVVLSVSDSGAGIPSEHMDRIFSPFFSTKPVGQGTGLGLAICHGVVAAHGGEIRVESNTGTGTRVTIELPATALSGRRATGG
jgi:PAS domain S-box-containing protein